MVETIGTGPKDRKRTTRKEDSMRIYGKILHTWTYTDEQGRERTSQIEVAYRDYNESGQLTGTGSEDFSPERWNQTTRRNNIWTWDGKKLNKGGHRWFEYQGCYTFRKEDSKAVKALYKNKFNAAAVDFR